MIDDSLDGLELDGIPENEVLALGLLEEELKAARFFDDLEQIGFDYTYYRPALARFILPAAGFSRLDDRLLQFYYSLLADSLPNVQPTGDAVRAVAAEMHARMMEERRRRARDC